MSSWFGGSLTSFTDQITTFTKDVLSESTQEIEDPVTELQVVGRQIDELKKEVSHYSNEVSRLRKSNEEFRERAETAELQLGSNKDQYLKLLQQRDTELTKMREEMKEMKDQQRKIVMSTRSDSNLPSLAAINTDSHNTLQYMDTSDSIWPNGEGGGGGEWGSLEDYELLESGEGVWSQSQVTSLQSELARLKVELQHWKELAQQSVKGHDSPANSTRGHYEEEGTLLEQQLQQERSHHEHEITSLQSIHQGQLETLTIRHKQEMDKLKKEIESLKEEREKEENNDDTPLSTNNDILTQELTQVKATNNILMNKLHSNQVIITELRGAINDMKQLIHTLQNNHLQHLKTEKSNLTLYMSDVQNSFTSHQVTIDSLQAQQTKYEEETILLNKELEQLKLNLERKESEIQLSFESEGHTQEGVASGRGQDEVTSLRFQLQVLQDKFKTESEKLQEEERNLKKERDKRETLQKHLTQLTTEHNRELEEIITLKNNLEAQLNSLANIRQSEEIEYEQKIKILTAENEKLNITLKEKKEEMRDERENLENQKSSADFEREMTQLRLQLEQAQSLINAKDQTIIELNHNKDELVFKLTQNSDNFNTQLSSQLITIEQLTRERDETAKRLNDLQTHHNLLQVEANKEEKSSQVLELETKCNKYSKDLERLREHLLQVEQHYTEEALKSEEREVELRQQLKVLANEMTKINEEHSTRSSNDHQSILQLQSQLQLALLERDETKQELKTVTEKAQQNSSSLQNLQNVLEHYERKGGEEELRQLLVQRGKELEEMRRECQRLTEIQQYNQNEREVNNESHDLMSHDQLRNEFSKEMSQKDKAISLLKSELEKYQLTLRKCRTKIEELSCDQDTSVDRLLVKNLFMQYLSVQEEKKKSDIVQLIGKVLGIESQEINQASGKKSRWLPTIWPAAPPTPSSKTTPTNEDQSISRIFISFLESESTTPTKPKAPPLLPRPPPPRHILAQAPPTKPSQETVKEDTSLAATELEKLLKT